ncbi:hypothetical protein F3Y22_tig00111837pilonHSYRG00013 [Hibiscus syriacus]|uniref:Calmodulin-binding domain-containing protein n=1 Tax=Hibiscus syriacus TaxID=106335 RepID=A0A6A2XAE3_HIBSY|nr:hypothetical protein F3Y22_tig00111837pilonHSYRG00013 [Hibiscus syriacus]
MANALVDIPAIRRIAKLENVHSSRHSTGKVIMQSGGLTVLSRYLQSSQGFCHDLCKYGRNVSPRKKMLRSLMLKIVVPKQGAGRNLERISGSNLVDRRKKTGTSVEVSSDFKVHEPDDHVVIKIAQTQGHHGENVEEDLIDTQNLKVSIRPSNDVKLQKPEYPAISLEPSCEDSIDIKAMIAEGEAKNEENVETKSPEGEKSQQVSVKPSPDSESQKPANPDCIEGGVSSWTDKEFVLPEQVLLSRKETDCAVAYAKDSKPRPQSKSSSIVRQTYPSGRQKSSGSKRKEANIMSMTSLGVSGGRNKSEMTRSKGIRTSAIAHKKNIVTPSVFLSPKEFGTAVSSMNTQKKKLRVVYHLNQDNAMQTELEKLQVEKHNSEQAKPANIPETTSYQIESNPENKPAKADRHNVVSTRTSSSPRDKTIKQNQHKVPISRSTHTPNGLEITQPSLTSLSSLATLESFHNDTSTEHNKAVVEKKKGSSELMYKVKHKRALMITLNNKNLPGKKLNFQKGEPVDNRNDDNQKGKVEDCTPRGLKFRPRVTAENRNGDNQNSRVEEFTPRRLKLRRKVIVDNTNDDNQNSRTGELSTRTIQFRQKFIVDNMNADNQKGVVDEFTTTRLELIQRALDNRNADDENGRGEYSTPRQLIFKQKVVDEEKTGCVQSPKPSTRENNSGVIEADVLCDNDTKIQSDKISLRQRGANEKNGSGILYNNIIKQTASKLVGTKASKVKALVRAFETVISHLDTSISETNDGNRATEGNLSCIVHI